MKFIQTVIDQMTQHGNFSFCILIVGIVQIALMITERFNGKK